MNKVNRLLPFISLLWIHPTWAELLQSISDDNVNVVIEPQPADKERHFEYRVFCSPGDEPLDDCQAEQGQTAVENKPTMVLPLPEFPPEAREPEPTQTPTKAEKRHAAQSSSKSTRATKTKFQRGDKRKPAAKNHPIGKPGKTGKAK